MTNLKQTETFLNNNKRTFTLYFLINWVEFVRVYPKVNSSGFNVNFLAVSLDPTERVKLQNFGESSIQVFFSDRSIGLGQTILGHSFNHTLQKLINRHDVEHVEGEEVSMEESSTNWQPQQHLQQHTINKNWVLLIRKFIQVKCTSQNS